MGACALLDVALGLRPWPPKSSEPAIRDQTLPSRVTLVLSLLAVLFAHCVDTCTCFLYGWKRGTLAEEIWGDGES